MRWRVCDHAQGLLDREEESKADCAVRLLCGVQVGRLARFVCMVGECENEKTGQVRLPLPHRLPIFRRVYTLVRR